MLDARLLLEDVIAHHGSKSRGNANLLMDQNDVLQCYLLLASTHRGTDAEEVLTNALEKMKGTSLEIQVIVELSRLLVKNNNAEHAVRVLKSVKKQPSSITAQLELANLYLQEDNEKEFIRCHKRNLNSIRTADTIISLGDAYMTAGSSEDALSYYKQAAKADPHKDVIVLRIGKTMLSLHDDDIHPVIQLYKNHLQEHPNHQLILLELAKLYNECDQQNQAITLLKTHLQQTEGGSELSTRLTLLILLTETYETIGETDEMHLSLEEAKDVCQRIVSGGKDSSNDLRSKLAAIFNRLARRYEDKGDLAVAEVQVTDALDIYCNDEESSVYLGQLLLKQGKVEECQHHCQWLRKMSPTSERVLELCGETFAAQAKYEDAIVTYKHLLSMDSQNYHALSKCIVLHHCDGKIEDIADLISNTEDDCGDTTSPGFQHAKGMSLLCQNRYQEAIICFSAIRGDGVWGSEAIIQMISIYLNRGVTGVSNIQSSITIVQKLLLELQSMSGVDQKRLQVINGYIHLYLGKTEVALKAFSEVLVNAKEYVPALLGLTKALLVVDPASNKARTVAKRITKLPYDAMYHEEFESSYLLLAEIYVQREKFDLAQELGNRVLKLNKSSAKAWEINGSVMELRGSYDEAANIYDKVLELM